MTSANGGRPVTGIVPPATPVCEMITAPDASFTCTHDVPVNFMTSGESAAVVRDCGSVAPDGGIAPAFVAEVGGEASAAPGADAAGGDFAGADSTGPAASGGIVVSLFGASSGFGNGVVAGPDGAAFGGGGGMMPSGNDGRAAGGRENS